jgi:hypothetical protein
MTAKGKADPTIGEEELMAGNGILPVDVPFTMDVATTCVIAYWSLA